MATYKIDLHFTEKMNTFLLLLWILPFVEGQTVTLTTTSQPPQTSLEGGKLNNDSTTAHVTITLSDITNQSEKAPMDRDQNTTIPIDNKSTITPTRDVSKIKDDPFFYDYQCLSHWGLVFAFILFTLGIIVLFSDRCNQCSCRRRQKRKYNITGV
ncbi:FXYD domain-containing ion transport regulator 6 isoform X1 [Pelobates cultripes]|uniref:FXYD domain-containing ion transport regulator n=1 Tax=Pelobates cultripes TaxID=61616 RepID=A0AAD1WQP9_PELCU|nr:FXYD domain-containing ion transport regulator 6 isoform X1 [Pelobates cultripes]